MYFKHEVRYLFWGLVTLALLYQFKFLIWLQSKVKKPWLYPLYPLAGIFLLQDFLYEKLVARHIFGEKSQDTLLTGRIKRMTEAGDWRAVRYERVLNEIDPGHV